jgi:stage II sporulation protein D
MFQRIKKMISLILIFVLLPYIITLFINGKKVGEEKKDGPNALLKAHCIRVLSQEVSSDYEEEMIKAQAIIVRTTIYKEVEEKGSSILQEEGFGDISDLEDSWYHKLEKIWDKTEGQVLMYEDSLAYVPFHQVSNGKTRLGSEVLGSEDYPYLQVKECPMDVEAAGQMRSCFIDVVGANVSKTDSAGYALEVTIGEEVVSAEHFRNTYGLASSCFDLQAFSENTRVITRGIGHGLGFSQYTANEMAKQGKTYQEMLQFFFEGTTLREVAEIFWDTE